MNKFEPFYEPLTNQIFLMNPDELLINEFEKISEGFQNGDFIASFSDFMDVYTNYENNLVHRKQIEKLRNIKRKRKLNHLYHNKRKWRVY